MAYAMDALIEHASLVLKAEYVGVYASIVLEAHKGNRVF